MTHSKAEDDYINEYTRKVLVLWADEQLRTGLMPQTAQEPYLAHARKKGWVSKKELKILSPGFKAAASYLRR